MRFFRKKLIFLFGIAVLLNSNFAFGNENKKVVFDKREVNIEGFSVSRRVIVFAEVCCMDEDTARDTPTWSSTNPHLVLLKIRMSKKSKITLYNREKREREQFSCEKVGCLNRNILIYKTQELPNEIRKLSVVYFCGGDFMTSELTSKEVEPHLGILVSSGQVKIDDVSSDQITCMPQDKNAIWNIAQ